MKRRIAGRTLAWLVIVLVVAVALVMAVKREGDSATSEDRVTSVARTIRCPQCRSQSAAESAAPAAVAIRAEIARRVAAGESTAAIQQYFVSRYGTDVLLSPEGSGFTALVWVLPVVGLVAGAALVVASLSRWRAPSVLPTLADTALVERALADTALVERAQADTALVERAQADTALVERAQADTVLVERAQADTALVERAQADTVPSAVDDRGEGVDGG